MDADAIMDVGYMEAFGLEALGRLVGDLVSQPTPTENLGPLLHDDRILSSALLVMFLAVLVLLYIFPVPD